MENILSFIIFLFFISNINQFYHLEYEIYGNFDTCKNRQCSFFWSYIFLLYANKGIGDFSTGEIESVLTRTTIKVLKQNSGT